MQTRFGRTLEKYKQKQVDEFIYQTINDYEYELKMLKEKIEKYEAMLNGETLPEKLKEKELQISHAIVEGVRIARKIEQEAEKRCQQREKEVAEREIRLEEELLKYREGLLSLSKSAAAAVNEFVGEFELLHEYAAVLTDKSIKKQVSEAIAAEQKVLYNEVTDGAKDETEKAVEISDSLPINADIYASIMENINKQAVKEEQAPEEDTSAQADTAETQDEQEQTADISNISFDMEQITRAADVDLEAVCRELGLMSDQSPKDVTQEKAVSAAEQAEIAEQNSAMEAVAQESADDRYKEALEALKEFQEAQAASDKPADDSIAQAQQSEQDEAKQVPQVIIEADKEAETAPVAEETENQKTLDEAYEYISHILRQLNKGRDFHTNPSPDE